MMKKFFALLFCVVLLSTFLCGQTITYSVNAPGTARVDSSVLRALPIHSVSDSAYVSTDIDLFKGSAEFYIQPFSDLDSVKIAVFSETLAVGQSVSAGDWVHVLVSWDYFDNADSMHVYGVYVNGDSVEYNTSSTLAQILGNTCIKIYNVQLTEHSAQAEQLGYPNWLCADSLYVNKYVGAIQNTALISPIDDNWTYFLKFPNDTISNDENFDSLSTSNYISVNSGSIAKGGDIGDIISGSVLARVVAGGSDSGVMLQLDSSFSDYDELVVGFWQKGDSAKAVFYDSTYLTNILDMNYIKSPNWFYREAVIDPIGGGNDTLIMKLLVKFSNDTAYFDGLTIVPNYLSNGDFRHFTSGVATGWSKYGFPSTIASAYSHNGSYCWQISNTNSSNYVYRNLLVGSELESGEYYSLQGYVKQDQGATHIVFGGSDICGLYENEFIVYDTNEWIKFSLFFKVSKASGSATLKVYNENNAATVYMDDFSLVKLEKVGSTAVSSEQRTFTISRPVILR